MNRNSELWFSDVPEITVPRSKFEMPTTHKDTWNDGEIIPMGIWEVLPGDTVNMKMSTVVRMVTPLYPTMDNCYMDVAFFYCPARLLWTHWKEFWGENTNAWYQNIEYEVPHVYTDDENEVYFEEGSVADHMGIPVGKARVSVSQLPFRGYVKIWNDWYRSEVVDQEAPTTMADNDLKLTSASKPAYKGGTVLKANKFFDYFTSALKSPQKGPSVMLPLGERAPVRTYGSNVPEGTETKYDLYWKATSGTNFTPATTYGIVARSHSTENQPYAYTNLQYTENQGIASQIYPSNLWADLTTATSATLGTIRQAIALQHFYERQAYGSRYIEFIKNIFGVTSPDARLQRSEFLGSKRIPINIYQATQQSATTESSPIGHTGAFSHTADADEYFTKSFTEHGYLYCMVVCRTEKSYSQGVDRMFTRRKFTDYYIPTFNSVGDQEIKNSEIYISGTDTDDEIFGYSERYAEYRYGNPNKLTGAFRPDATNSLDAWHYGEDYDTTPALSATWLKEDRSVIDRTLAVTDGSIDQFFGDFFFNPTWVRPMPIHSVPGLSRI